MLCRHHLEILYNFFSDCCVFLSEMGQWSMCWGLGVPPHAQSHFPKVDSWVLAQWLLPPWPQEGPGHIGSGNRAAVWVCSHSVIIPVSRGAWLGHQMKKWLWEIKKEKERLVREVRKWFVFLSFWARSSAFHFALGPTNYEASPALGYHFCKYMMTIRCGPNNA